MEKLYTKEVLNKIAPGTGIPRAILLNDTEALTKRIVSFGAAKCKRNTRSLLAVIFILKNIKDGTYGTKKKTPETPEWLRIN